MHLSYHYFGGNAITQQVSDIRKDSYVHPQSSI